MAQQDQEKRQPWMKFYPADWQADEGLGQCSLMARGLWIEVLAIMHKSPVIGHLLIAGKPPNASQIAVQVKSDVKTVTKAMKELEEWGVFSKTEVGVIFSRRMVADAEKADRDRANGKGGGNPILTKNIHKGVNPKNKHTDNREYNQSSNMTVNGVDKAQKLEARSQKEAVAFGNDGDSAPAAAAAQSDPFPRYANPPGKPPMPCRGDPPDAWKHLAPLEADGDGPKRAAAGGYFLDTAAELVCEAAQIRDEHWRGDWRPLIAWLRDNIDLHAVIIPAIRQVAARPNYRVPASLQYFDRAVRQAHASAAA
ncbi:MAG: hypothetical protein KGJ73_10930 [Rhodospirillales bacterium]|nr:hypothetical protein [Rhodospirillales bacterium]